MSGYWYLVKDARGENLGIAFVRDYGDVNVGVRVIGHQGAKFEGPLTEAELGTYDAFNLFRQLEQVDAKEITIQVQRPQDAPNTPVPEKSIQVAFKVPGEDYPMDGTPIFISGNVLR